MTARVSPGCVDFLARLKRLDNTGLKTRDILVLWAIGRQSGMMGREIAMQLGYRSRSNIQDGITRLIDNGYIEDRRVCSQKDRQKIPNDLHILPAGTAILTDIVPE